MTDPNANTQSGVTPPAGTEAQPSTPPATGQTAGQGDEVTSRGQAETGGQQAGQPSQGTQSTQSGQGQQSSARDD